jgi:hypothetical protein
MSYKVMVASAIHQPILPCPKIPLKQPISFPKSIYILCHQQIMGGKLTLPWRVAPLFKLLCGVSICLVNSPLHTKFCRILDIFWCFPKVLHYYSDGQRISGSNRHSWNHSQRAHVFNDAFDFYHSDEISSITTIHWTFGSLHYCCKLIHVIVRNQGLAAYRKSGCPLRGCR